MWGLTSRSRETLDVKGETYLVKCFRLQVSSFKFSEPVLF